MVILAYGLWFMLMVLYWKVKHLVETFIVFHKNLCKCISFLFFFFFFPLLLTVSGQTSKGFLSNSVSCCCEHVQPVLDILHWTHRQIIVSLPCHFACMSMACHVL